MSEETPRSPAPTPDKDGATAPAAADAPAGADGVAVSAAPTSGASAAPTAADAPAGADRLDSAAASATWSSGALGAALRELESQFTLVMGRPERVTEACRIIAAELAAIGDPQLARDIDARAVALLTLRQGGVALALLPYLETRAGAGGEPGLIVRGLLAARDDLVRRRGIEVACSAMASGRVTADGPVLSGIASALELDATAAADTALLRGIETAWRENSPGPGPEDDPLERQLLHGTTPEARLLAARLLDLSGAPVPVERLRRLFGADVATLIAPYLEYTRATHRDLVELTPESQLAPTLLSSLRDAERTLGGPLLGEVLGELGWSRLAWGFSCQRLIGLSLDGGFPLAVTPAEALFLSSCGPARRAWDRFVVVAHGGSASASDSGDEEVEAVQRFRKYNLLHAELLGEILEVAPLTPVKARRILERLEQVVGHFAALFRGHSEDAARVEERYAALCAEVLRSIGLAPDAQPLDAEATRIVQMFEDPRSLDEVRTLHGLKRYLHQEGLRLAFRAFRSGRATNRTVDLALASASRVLHVVRRIRYIDFEPDPLAEPGVLPYPVALIAEVLGRRLVHGKVESPDFEILAYGNEVQIFIGFRNHPVFLRLDLSPPQRGGMIDLEYYGVSQYELDQHPDLSLQWVQRVFRRLDFDVNLEQYRLHVRYDKERALDLGDLLAHVRVLGFLLPHLMELDWVIAALDYPEAAKARVADAWADLAPCWGWLPLAELLTRDRRRIRCGVAADPAGEREVAWDGQGEYRDRFTGVPDRTAWDRIHAQLESGGLARFVFWDDLTEPPVAQIPLETRLFHPLREAVHLGGLRETLAGPVPTAPGDTPAPHEAEELARLLAAGGADLLEAARVAAVVGSVERHLRFVTSGTIQGYPVQRATLVLRGERVDLSVLRDVDGICRLALALDCPIRTWTGIRGGPPCGAGPRLRSLELVRRLRRDNYVNPGYETSVLQAGGPPALAAVFALPNALAPPRHAPGDRVVPGIVASPGVATGFARFGAEGRPAEDLDGAILFAPAIRPDDAPLLRRSAAVVSTGGGILSHAGLIALEMHKPALVISGHWRREADGSCRLAYRHLDFREEERAIGPYAVRLRRDLREREEMLREGDLVVVDAEIGTLTVLGQDRDALALQEELRRLDLVAAELGREEAGPQLLALRGRWHRAVHQLEKLLGRLDRPALARHAARELLFARSVVSAVRGRDDVSALLQSLFANRIVGEAARQAARRQHAELSRRHAAYVGEALRIIPISDSVPEILHLRLGVIRVRRRLDALARLLNAVRLATAYAGQHPDLDLCARRRLEELRESVRRELESAPAGGDSVPPAETPWMRRHLLARLQWLDRLLPGSIDGATAASSAAGSTMEARELPAPRPVLARGVAGRLILHSEDGGQELAPFVGSKGANLGEVVRILGPERVPRFFSITDAAFQGFLDGPPGGAAAATDASPGGRTLRDAIAEILARSDLGAAAKSMAIRQLWVDAPLPAGLPAALDEAYQTLGEEQFVAIRSSAFEEDSASASWTGQFDTFLFIRGAESVREHLKLAMASLWTERAILQREQIGDPVVRRGGGIVVQKVVNARAAGVLHTLSVTAGQAREMVINVGLGLGEGVVSGTVDVDHIVVSREADPREEPLRFHYQVGDKDSRIAFDEAAGSGTRREETLYHQRLRPALEYSDLRELISAAARLESVYGYPLDIEFAFEEAALYILQVRPIVAFQNALRETIEQAPLRAGESHPGEESRR